MNSQKKILLLHDSPVQACLLERQLQALGFICLRAETVAQAESLVIAHDIRLALLDVLPARGNGFQWGRQLLEKLRLRPILLTTADRHTDAAWAAKLGFAQTLVWPGTKEQLQAVLAEVLAQL
ncbi:MAG: response regulator [Pseudomonadales bacterium]|nr:response regulator [Pseudomonadales bacterium]